MKGMIGKGQDYSVLKKAIHIGILDFTLFEENCALHSMYQLMDAKTHYIYTSKFQLHVIDLTQLDRVSEAEKKSELYYWVKLFKAVTWEELMDMAEQSETILETVFTLHEMTEDEKIKEQCAARERYERDWLTNYNAGREEGREDGREEGKKSVVRTAEKLFQSGMNYDQVRAFIDEELVPDKELLEIQKRQKGTE